MPDKKTIGLIVLALCCFGAVITVIVLAAGGYWASQNPDAVTSATAAITGTPAPVSPSPVSGMSLSPSPSSAGVTPSPTRAPVSPSPSSASVTPSPTGCSSCYGAKDGTCLTCADVITAYTAKNWRYDRTKFKQCTPSAAC
jgi:hypothetical protein